MSFRYLFNTAGDYVAFQRGGYVFTPSGGWLGFVKGGNRFFGTDGRFVGYILSDDRVARNVNEAHPPNTNIPQKPLRPLTPLHPLKRLRQPKLQFPFEDVFEAAIKGSSSASLEPTPSLDSIEGATLQAADGTFLGTVSQDKFRPDSLANEYGEFGNPYSPKSIFNEYGPYGNPYSQLSPFNNYSRTPPLLLQGGQIVAYLTANTLTSPRVDPLSLRGWLGM